ncbi:MAG: hypothetical protein V7720_01645 [Halioglobus sp.]
MKSLQYIFIAVLLCCLAYFLTVVLLVTGPVIYVVVLGAALFLLLALLVGLYAIVKSLITRLFGIGSDDSADQKASEPIFQPVQVESLSREVYRDARESIGDAKEFIRVQLSRIWSDVEEDLARMSIAIQKRSKKGRKIWMRKRIEQFIEAHQNTYDLLSQKMNDEILSQLRVEYSEICNKINDLEKELGDIKASIAMKGEAPGGAYHRLAEKTKASLDRAELDRLEKIEQSRQRLVAYGVEMDPQQAEVLLSRVDAGDIMRMTTVFTIISKMTEQFANAKLQSGENLDVTKKYYGMYIALLELQLYIQEEYLNRLQNDYIPGIEEIREGAQELNKETRSKAKSSDDKHKPLYEKNLESQTFTLEVTRIYRDALIADAQKVNQAKEMLRKHHDVAENTLKTVQVSSDLSALMTQNESLYHEVMALQVPDLVPFENLQMQREFEAVTARLRA